MSDRITVKQLEDLLSKGKIRGYKINGPVEKEKKKSKYGNKEVIVLGKKFDSKKEGNRYFVLHALMLEKKISNLQLQVEYKFEVEGKKIASYFADFVYDEKGKTVVEDVKSAATRKLPVYRIKNKLMKAIYGIEIKEV